MPLREAGGKGDFMPAVNTQIALSLWPGTLSTEMGHPISPVLFLCCLSPPDCEIGDRLQIHYLIYFVLTIWDGPRGVEWRWSAWSHSQAVSEWILGHGSGWAHATTLLSQLVRAWGMLEHSDRAFQNYWIFQSPTWFQSQLLSTNKFTISDNSEFVSWPEIYLCVFHEKS